MYFGVSRSHPHDPVPSFVYANTTSRHTSLRPWRRPHVVGPGPEAVLQFRLLYRIAFFLFWEVPRTGLEPARSQNHSHLKRTRLPIPPPGQSIRERAEDGTRTRDPNLGKVMLYQLSYFRICNRFVLDCECKGSDFIETTKPLRYFFIRFF